MEIFVFFMQVFGTGLLSPTALELCSLATEGTQEITERTEIIPSQAKSLSLTDDTDHTDGSLLRRELGPAEIAEIAEIISVGLYGLHMPKGTVPELAEGPQMQRELQVIALGSASISTTPTPPYHNEGFQPLPQTPFPLQERGLTAPPVALILVSSDHQRSGLGCLCCRNR